MRMACEVWVGTGIDAHESRYFGCWSGSSGGGSDGSGSGVLMRAGILVGGVVGVASGVEGVEVFPEYS